jgi:hypothetical protein
MCCTYFHTHCSTLPTYGVPEGRLLRTVLTGVDIFRDTWFQLEGANWSPAKHPIDSIIHAVRFQTIVQLHRAAFACSQSLNARISHCAALPQGNLNLDNCNQ